MNESLSNNLQADHGIRAAQGWFELGLSAEAEAEIAAAPAAPAGGPAPSSQHRTEKNASEYARRQPAYGAAGDRTAGDAACSHAGRR